MCDRFRGGGAFVAPSHSWAAPTRNGLFWRGLNLKIFQGILSHLHRIQGRIQRFLKGGTLYVGHRGWPAKKILGFRWSKKAEVTLETISFWQNISISIFKFSPFLSIKSYQFTKFLIQQSVKKEKLRKVGLCVITGCFIKLFKMIGNHFSFCFSSSFTARLWLFDIRDIKREIGNDKWQIKYLFQK